MEMLNKCLEVTDDMRAKLEAFDRASRRNNSLINQLDADRANVYGNRAARRRQAAIERKSAKLST